MNKFLLITLASSFIIACNGEDGGNANAITPDDNKPAYLSVEEIEQRLNLPEEITMDEANSSLIGPETNGIRNDIKRIIAFHAPESTNEDAKVRSSYERWAQIWTEVLKNQDNLNKLNELRKERLTLIECFVNNYIPAGDLYESFDIELTNGHWERIIILEDFLYKTSNITKQEITELEYKEYCDKL